MEFAKRTELRSSPKANKTFVLCTNIGEPARGSPLPQKETRHAYIQRRSRKPFWVADKVRNRKSIFLTASRQVRKRRQGAALRNAQALRRSFFSKSL